MKEKQLTEDIEERCRSVVHHGEMEQFEMSLEYYVQVVMS